MYRRFGKRKVNPYLTYDANERLKLHDILASKYSSLPITKFAETRKQQVMQHIRWLEEAERLAY